MCLTNETYLSYAFKADVAIAMTLLFPRHKSQYWWSSVFFCWNCLKLSWRSFVVTAFLSFLCNMYVNILDSDRFSDSLKYILISSHTNVLYSQSFFEMLPKTFSKRLIFVHNTTIIFRFTNKKEERNAFSWLADDVWAVIYKIQETNLFYRKNN